VLPGKRIGSGTLFLVIGAQSVECAVFVENQWQQESIFKIQIDHVQAGDSPMTALIAAIAQLESAISRWQELQPVNASPVVRHVKALVADTWLSAAQLPWSAATKHAATAKASVREQLVASGFSVEPLDTVRLDDAPFGQPRLAIAYPASLLEALSSLTVSLDATLVSVLPLSVVAWTWVRKQHHDKFEALAVQDERLLLVMYGQDRLADVTVRAASASEPKDISAAQTLRDQWQRMRLRDPQLARVEQLAVLNLLPSAKILQEMNGLVGIELPPQSDTITVSPRLHLALLSDLRHQPLDALPPGYNMTPMRWLVAGIALFLIGFLLAETWQTTRYAQALVSAANATQSNETAVTPDLSWSREEMARVQAVNGVIRELNLPIASLLQALQPPRDIRVAVLSIEIMGASSINADNSSGVKIVAEARTGEEMASYVSFISAHKIFTGAYLMRHEIVDSVPERPYRFTVEAVWSE